MQTTENPADIASRGTTTSKLLDFESWWNVPLWLSTPEAEWPKFENDISELVQKQVDSEVTASKTKKDTTLLQPLQQIQKTVNDEMASYPLQIDIKRFSSLTKLLRVTALALKFIRILKKSSNERQFITSDEIDTAEEMLLNSVQKRWYPDVFDSIYHNKRHNLQVQLGLFVNKAGLLRCKGRLENADLSAGARFSILLSKKDKFTYLLIEKTHRELLHSGVSQCLSTIRNGYWIPHGRAAVKTVLKSCTVCRRYEGGPFKMPAMSPLPVSRVAEASPFTRVG